MALTTPAGPELTVGNELLAVALRHARDAEIFWAREESATAGFEGSSELPSSRREGEGMALRVISGGRIGFAVHLGPLSTLQPSVLLKEAVARAAAGPEAPPTFYKHRESTAAAFTWDDGVAAMGPDHLRRIARQACMRLSDLFGEGERSIVARRTVRRLALLSRTSEKRCEKTLMQFRVQASPTSTPGVFTEVWASCRAAEDPMAVLGSLAWKAALSREVAIVEPGVFPVLLSPRAAGTLMRWVCSGFLGARLVSGASPLGAHLGERIFDERLSLADDPTVPWNPAGGSFDGEGVARKRNLLVDRGVLTGFLLDLPSAWKLGMEPTGSATRTMDAPPVAAPSFLDLSRGGQGFDELLEACEGGLYVEAFDEEVAPDDGGDFTSGIREGFAIRRGRPVGWVSGLAVQANVYHLLGRQLVGVGGDTTTTLGSRCGSLAFRDVSLVAD